MIDRKKLFLLFFRFSLVVYKKDVYLYHTITKKQNIMYTKTDFIIIILAILTSLIISFTLHYIEGRKEEKEKQKETERLNNIKAMEQKEKNEKKEMEAALQYWKNYVNS
jgi:mannitol-specific phosphotransferase system IIBC component